MKVLFVLALAIILYGISITIRKRRYIPKYAGEWVVPRRRLTKADLLFIATGGKLVMSALVSLWLCALLILVHLGDGMGLPQTIVSCALILLFMALLLIPTVTNDLRPLMPLLRDTSGNNPLGRGDFRYFNYSWQYVDGDWFIRAGGNESCALYAPSIDFAAEARFVGKHVIEWRLKSILAYDSNGVQFRSVDGQTVTVSAMLDEELTGWIEAHGGCVRG